jgi:Papain fold toxin 2
MPSNSQFSDEEIYQQIGAIVINFKLLQCVECAEAIKNWLKLRSCTILNKPVGAGSPAVKNVANRLDKPARPHEKSPD